MTELTLYRADWTYASGVTAVAETRVLTNDEYLDLLRLPNLQALVQRIRQVETYVAMPAPETPEQATRFIEREYIAAVRRLAGESPDTKVCEMMLAHYMFAEIRSMIREEFFPELPHAEHEPYFTERELDILSNNRVDARRDLAEMADRIRAKLRAKDDPTDHMDLMLDCEEITWFLELARATGSDFIMTWTATCVRLYAAQAILRARLSGERSDRLVQTFLAPPLDDDWLLALATDVPERLDNILMQYFTPAEGEIIQVSRQTIGRIARMMDDRLTREMMPAKGVAFGPERILGFLWALYIENLNLRLIAETFVVEADRDETRTRLRQSYVG